MKKKETLTYMDSVHRAGRIWGLTLFVLILAFPFAVAVIFQAPPKWGPLARGTLAILPMYWAVGIVEIVSKNLKLAIAPMVLMLALFIFVPGLNAGTVGIMVPVGVLFTLAVARFLYKKGKLS